jgi:diguanylate cyclase (GGDEF)-like protein
VANGGDQLLIATSRRIESCLRRVDRVARLGGDEFAILLEEIVDIQDALKVAGRIQGELALPFDLDNHRVSNLASIGIVLSEERYVRPEEILRDADTAMRRAKVQGKARYAIFETAMRDWAMARLDLEADLRSALERKGVRLY